MRSPRSTRRSTRPWLAICFVGLVVAAFSAPPVTAEGSTPRAAGRFTVPAEGPPITLYETSWCGYCRKTRHLLQKLDADFVSKDVEKDPRAAREARAKTGGGGGVPVIDFAGVVVEGYDARQIRQIVDEMREVGALSPKGQD